ncbi:MULTISPECIES: SGNH/GDSL hydrolase family protein [unclassified Synechococcus]|uniref:SGNH/GDSL hydrolase family protein n=1 Tax=unclassified Synechococcus TaxID=2626047 RepID=UPI0000698ABC|nr:MULTISPECIES: SGNH/GDSL hydrolase family protein [unclassified Synechococcus]EAQ74059.1 Peptidase, metallopeptidase [Synechococcus sp. WH 5701]WFN58050.1 GDSL-type esterase/lipase family protein [Synechococcus sp. CCFWC 502]
MLTIMPMGDSITHGFNVPGGYRKPLDELLRSLGLSPNFVGRYSQSGDTASDRDHWGRPGWGISRTDAAIGGRNYVSLQANEGPQGAIRDGLFQDLDQAISTSYFSREQEAINVLLLMIGSNDIVHQVVEQRDGAVAAGDRNNDGQGEQQNRIAEASIDRLKAFLDEVNRLAAREELQLELIVATIPTITEAWNRDRLRDPISSVILQELREYNDFIRDTLPDLRYSQLRLRVVDQFKAVGNDLIDGLHPSSQAFERMAATWGEAIEQVVAERAPAPMPMPLVHALQVNEAGQLAVAPGDAAISGIELSGDAVADDTLLGSAELDQLRGLGGHDSLRGLAGDDRLFGNQGDDLILGNEGHDYLVGGQGDDLIRGGRGRDLISGGLGADILFGGFGTNIFLSSADGDADTMVISSDQFLVNPFYAGDANNVPGGKVDVIEAIDDLDRIVILGVDSADLSLAPARITDSVGRGLEGLGIFARGNLEALLLGSSLDPGALTGRISGVIAEEFLQLG